MKGLKSIVLTACAAVISIALIPAHSASAATSAALSIVPKKNYVVEPGKTIKDTLVIRNLDSKSTLDLTLRVVDFTYNDDGGTPKLMLAEDAPQTTWSLKPFLKVPQKVTVEPNKSTTVNMNVAIPAGQGAGSYYSAIVYSSGDSDGKGNVGLNASGVTLAFVTVPGQAKEDLKLERFGAYMTAEGKRSAQFVAFATEDPKNVAYTLKNNGNVAEAPVGTITIKPLFGGDKTISDVNPNQSLALIGQTRTYTACVALKAEQVNFNGSETKSKVCDNTGLWPGFYRLSLDMFYGQNGNKTQELNGSSWFIYMPVWSIIVLIVLLLVLGLFGYKGYSAVRGKVGKKSSRKK